MEKHYIYKLTSPSGKVYIGRTRDYESRMRQHEYRHSRDVENKVLYSAIKKYGWENFIKEIIGEVDSSDAPDLEKLMIIKYDAVSNGYNMTYATNGGDVWNGRRDTREYLDYVEKSRKNAMGIKNGMYGKKHDNRTKDKMSHPGEKNGMYGRKHRDESIKIQKEKAKGRYSLDWFIERNGVEDGTRLYNERCTWLKNRNMPKDKNGKFCKKDNSFN